MQFILLYDMELIFSILFWMIPYKSDFLFLANFGSKIGTRVC